MKVLYVTSNYESVQSHLAAQFRKQGHDFRLMCFQMGGRKWKQSFPESEIILRSTVPSKGPFLYYFKLRRLAGQAAERIPEDRPEILHGNMMFRDGYICRKLNDKYNIPYVITVRDTDLNGSFLWQLPWLRRMGIKNLLSAKKIIFLSEPYRELLLRKLPQSYKKIIEEKSAVIPNGIDDYFLINSYRKEPRSPGKDITVIFIGKVSRRKNIETATAALRLLESRGYSIKFKVIGEITEEEYRSFPEKNSDLIEYLGICSKEQIIRQLRLSDIFVLPSHTESFGLVYAEAISQGVPVIYTRGQGFDRQFPEGEVGYSVSDRDPGEIADKIEMILANYTLISQSCTRSAEKFSWENTVNEFIKLYRQP